MSTADSTGTLTGGPWYYDPYGNLNTTGADNSDGLADNGWLGSKQRLTEHETGTPTLLEMGARAYSPATGRFLETDPIEGGSANDHDYVDGDPVNGFDLAGTCHTRHHGWSSWRNWRCTASRRIRHGARRAHHWASKNRWKLAGWAVSTVCIVGSGGAGLAACITAGLALYGVKTVATVRARGGWRQHLVNAVSTYADMLPGLGVAGESFRPLVALGARAVAGSMGFAWGSMRRCASPH
jgi:RHS repeat-associated protein